MQYETYIGADGYGCPAGVGYGCGFLDNDLNIRWACGGTVIYIYNYI